MRPRRVMKLLLMILAALLLVREGRSHDAPSGWPYPADCCSGDECQPIACESITSTPTGDFVQNGVTYKRSQLRLSGDQDCHRCISKTGNPHCIIIPPRS